MHFPDDQWLVEHMLMCLLVIFMLSLEKCIFKSSANILIRLLIFYGKLYILDINLLPIVLFANIFFPFSMLPFHFIDCFLFLPCKSFCLFVLVRYNPMCLFFSFVSLAWGHSQKNIPNTDFRAYCKCFLLEVLWFQILHWSLYPILSLFFM